MACIANAMECTSFGTALYKLSYSIKGFFVSGVVGRILNSKVCFGSTLEQGLVLYSYIMG